MAGLALILRLRISEPRTTANGRDRRKQSGGGVLAGDFMLRLPLDSLGANKIQAISLCYVAPSLVDFEEPAGYGLETLRERPPRWIAGNPDGDSAASSPVRQCIRSESRRKRIRRRRAWSFCSYTNKQAVFDDPANLIQF